jgi:hypothetical protein
LLGIFHLLASASLSLSAPPSTIDRALTTAVREIEAAASIKCTKATAPGGYSCVQPSKHDRDRFAAVSVTVRPARKPIRAGAVVLDTTSVGPGGGSTRYVGQTADHRYDIVVTQAELSGPGDRWRLPTAPKLITRIAFLYARGR